jgi:predicted DNA-binding protein with PD1-like motif
MKSKLVAQKGDERTFVVILDAGEEAVAAITRFAEQAGLNGASLTALGAFEHAKVGWIDFEARKYREIPIDAQCEVLSVVGDIATGDDKRPSLHMHAVLGLSDGTTRGGHLISGAVRPTLEVTIVESAAHLRRRRRPDLGIALIDLPEPTIAS